MKEFWWQGSNESRFLLKNCFERNVILIWPWLTFKWVFKIGHLEFKVFQKLKLSKNVNNKQRFSRMTLIKEKISQKDWDDFWHWKLTLKVRFRHFFIFGLKVSESLKRNSSAEVTLDLLMFNLGKRGKIWSSWIYWTKGWSRQRWFWWLAGQTWTCWRAWSLRRRRTAWIARSSWSSWGNW